jgi:hypothetical protein
MKAKATIQAIAVAFLVPGPSDRPGTADANQAALRAVLEDTYGTMPVDDAGWFPVYYTAETLTASPQVTTSQVVDGNRLPKDKVITSTNVGGGVDFEFQASAFDAFLEAVMCGTWTADVLDVDTTDRSFCLEKEFQDLAGGNKFLRYYGMRVDSMSFALAYGQPVTGSLAFVGQDSDANAASGVGAGSETPPAAKGIMVAAPDFGSFQIDAGASSILVMEANIQIANNMRAINALGSVTPNNQKKGDANITGSLRCYLDQNSLDLYERALANTDTQIEFTMTRGGDLYAFDLPQCKLSGEAPQSQGRNTDVMVEVSFEAILVTPTITRTIV